MVAAGESLHTLKGKQQCILKSIRENSQGKRMAEFVGKLRIWTFEGHGFMGKVLSKGQ